MHATVTLAVAIIIAAAVIYAAACLADLARSGQTRHLPKWAWAVLICISIPWGGLAYLLFGRAWRHGGHPAGQG
jgi:hypothetical protein